MSNSPPALWQQKKESEAKGERERRKLYSQVFKYPLEGMIPSSGGQFTWTHSESSPLTFLILALKVPCPRKPINSRQTNTDGHPNLSPHTGVCTHTHSSSSSSSNYVHVALGLNSGRSFTSSGTRQVSLVGSSFVYAMESCIRAGVTTQTKSTSSGYSGLSTQANFHFSSLRLAYCAQVLLYPDPFVSKEVPLRFLMPWLAGRRCLARIG